MNFHHPDIAVGVLGEPQSKKQVGFLEICLNEVELQAIDVVENLIFDNSPADRLHSNGMGVSDSAGPAAGTGLVTPGANLDRKIRIRDLGRVRSEIDR